MSQASSRRVGGLECLGIQHSRQAFHPKFAQALKRGVAWLDQNFNGVTNTNANEWTYYYLYGIERVALGSGLRFFNNQDWYQTGARHIVQVVSDNEGIDDDLEDLRWLEQRGGRLLGGS